MSPTVKEASDWHDARQKANTYIRVVDLVPRILKAREAPRIATPFPRMDEQIEDGLRPRTVTGIIGGFGGGKTSFAMQLAAHHSLGAPVLYYLAELVPEQGAARLVGQLLERSWRDTLDDDSINAAEMTAVLAPLNLYILPRSSDPIGDIQAALDELEKTSKAVPMLVVDYIQIATDLAAARGDQRIAVMEAVNGIHRLTEGRELITLLVSQSSRQGNRQIKEAAGEASDLLGVGAETSAIEAACAVQLVLSFSRPDNAAEFDVTLNIAKARFGTPGKVGLRFNAATGRWTELDHPPPTAGQLARREEILDSLRAAGGGPLSKNKIRERHDEEGKRHRWVTGSKDIVNREIDLMAAEGLLREAACAYFIA